MNRYLYTKGDTTFNNIELDVVTAVGAWFKSLGVESDIKISTDASSDHLELKATAGTVSFTISAQDEAIKTTELDGLEILDLDGGYNEYKKHRTNP